MGVAAEPHNRAATRPALLKGDRASTASVPVTNPDFAVPPNDDQLPKPTPVQAWQQGTGKWHVDAPVAVVGQRVLVASAFLDKEKEGDRALFCLDAKTGDIQWRAPLKYNPWGGPSVINDLIVVTGSTIGYEPKLVKVAKGGIAAFDLATGKEKWHKDLNAGIVSCAALTKELAVVCANCHSHLAHVFAGEGYDTPTDLRYCINSISLTLEPDGA